MVNLAARSIRESSEITNELGNHIEFEIYSQGDNYPNHPDLQPPIVRIKAKGRSGEADHQWTLEEARELHRLLGLVFPAIRASNPSVGGGV